MIRVLENAYAPHLRQAHHAHETTTVSLVLAGALRESVGAAEEIAQTLSVVVKPRAPSTRTSSARRAPGCCRSCSTRI